MKRSADGAFETDHTKIQSVNKGKRIVKFKARMCETCKEQFIPISTRGMYCQSRAPQCSSNKPANDEYEVEMLELEISEEEEETGTVTSIITDLKEEIEKLNQMLKIKDQQIRNLEETNLKLKIKLADQILEKGTMQTMEKLTRRQMITAQKKIESAFEGREMNVNSIQLKPITKGKIAIQLCSEKHKSVAIQQLNQLTETTGFIAIPKKLPRLMIKNVPLDYLPENLTEKLAQKYPLMYDLLSSENTIGTLKVVTI